MSFFGLTLVGSALDAAQVSANVTSNDIANVNTPGASRQQVNLEPSSPIVANPAYTTHSGPGTVGDGVTVQSIQRIHQDSYDTLFRGASTSENFYSVQQDQLNATQAQLAQPNAGISAALSAFQTSIQSLAANPADSPTRQNVIQQAQALVSVLNTTGQAIQTQQAQVIQQAQSTVVKINGILDQIAALNSQIRASTAVGDNPNTFKDQRDYLIDQLSQYIATQTSVQANGSTLVEVQGLALVNDTIAYHIGAPVVGTDSTGNPVLKVGFANAPNASNPTPIPVGTSGQLGAYLDLYNNKLTPYLAQLNNFTASLATEVDRVSQASLDANGNPGAPLFQPVVAGSAISAGNIRVGVSDPSQITSALASTAAGSLISPANSANNVIDTSALIDGNVSLNNAPLSPAGVQGYLTISVDGITPAPSSVPPGPTPVQTFWYNTAPGQNADTIGDFINNFNAGHFGVTASWDTASQRIVFARDPSNIDLVHRANEGANPPTAAFTITDFYNTAPGTYTQVTAANSGLASGAAAPSLLLSLAAGSISGVAQNSLDAFGAGDNAGATALLNVFNSNVGIGALQTTSPTAIVAANLNLPTVIQPPAGTPLAFAQVQVGQVLTVDAQPNGASPQEDVTVTAVNRATGSITAVFTKLHSANFSITTKQSQTLGQAFGALTTQIGLDAQTAITGTTTQTSLTTSINQVRQSIDGINIDEETQNLIKFQNAYQAAAQNMSVLEQMLGTILTMASNI